MIGEKAKRVLEDNIGLSMNQIRELSSSEEISHIKARTGKNLVFSRKYDPRKIGRGNPPLARRKFKTIDEINAKIDTLRK